ncbi:hypothetical protein MK489_01320 [Myxococcota bacterium]|nr:hypothetical protein [Myxococcota bacterium]
MEYVEVAEAIERPGLRLVLTMGVPGPWGEAAKNILWVKGIDYAPVCQRASTEDPLLLEWTRQTGAPVAMYEKERPRSSWAEILFLAERLAPERPLLPQGPMDRALALGLLHEIAGEQGLGWSRRLMMFARNSVGPADSGSMPWKYGLDDPGATAGAGRRVDAILQLLASRLAEQQAAGRRFFVGEALSAVDLYWAAFSNLVVPMPAELCPMPDFLREIYDVANFPELAPVDPSLIAHRDELYREFLPLPFDF